MKIEKIYDLTLIFHSMINLYTITKYRSSNYDFIDIQQFLLREKFFLINMRSKSLKIL